MHCGPIDGLGALPGCQPKMFGMEGSEECGGGGFFQTERA